MLYFYYPAKPWPNVLPPTRPVYGEGGGGAPANLALSVVNWADISPAVWA
jgi:hypothetical protein